MRSDDMKRLQEAYAPDSSGRIRSSDDAFAEQVGASLPSARELLRALFEDLDDSAGLFGVGWWFPHPGTRRRTLISDYLVSAVGSIETHLVEARLHYLEALDAFYREDEYVSRMVDYEESSGRASLKHPRRSRGVDDLPRLLRDLHVVGFFRAVGSALDCLAAAVVGVLGLPLNIQKTSLSKVRKFAEQKEAEQKEIEPASAEERVWKPTFGALTNFDSEKPGWLTWTLSYRNTLVHRGRPATQFSLVPQRTLDRPGSAIPHVRTSERMLLPRDPGRSTVEVLQGSDTPVLTEDARTTMECVFELARQGCETLAVPLLDAWADRRADRSLIAQPRKQWPDVPSAEPSTFKGCAPGSEEYKPALLSTGPDMTRRMKAASLLDDDLANWSSFD